MPVFFIWLIKDKGIQPFYGTKPLESLRPYLLMLLVMVPLLAVAGTQSDFLQVYPKAKLINKILVHNWVYKGRYIVFELCYGFDFVSIEFFSGVFSTVADAYLWYALYYSRGMFLLRHSFGETNG